MDRPSNCRFVFKTATVPCCRTEVATTVETMIDVHQLCAAVGSGDEVTSWTTIATGEEIADRWRTTATKGRRCAVRFSQQLHSVVSELVDTVDDNFQSDFTIATRVTCGLMDVVVIWSLVGSSIFAFRETCILEFVFCDVRSKK
jgi:hypothetical protein